MSQSPGTVDRLGEERSRLQPRRVRQWLLVDGNRLVLSAAVLVGFYATLVALARLGVLGFEDPDALTRIVGGTVAGVLSLVTIVLAINQLIVNPELGHAGQTMDRLEGARSLKEEVESVEHVDVSPVEPVAFLQTLATNIDRNVAAVELTAAAADDVDASVAERASSDVGGERGAGEGERDGGDGAGVDRDGADELATEAAGLAEHVRTQIGRVDEELQSVTFTAYNEVLVDAHRETSWLLFVVRRFWREHADRLSGETEAALEELLRSLELFHVAQNYFKTTYVQRELAHLSRLMLLAAIPGVTAAYVAGLVYASPEGLGFSPTIRVWVVPALFTVALTPLAVFATYILRVATLVSETVHVGPFTTIPR